jgi:LPS sulfotransferase NodH
LFFTGEAPAYVIAATPRTGSSWLCGLLCSLGYTGFPVEYAREIDEQVWRGAYGLPSHAAYFWSLPARSSTPNGIFGLKVLWMHLLPLVHDIHRYTACRGPSEKLTIDYWMGHPTYFWLRRRDRLRQAVSLKRAEQTDRWASTQVGNGLSPLYSRAGIERALARIAREEAGWAAYFDASAAPVTELWYEDLAAEPGAVLELITDTLGLPKPAGWRSLLERQADRLNDTWVDEFERDRARPGDLAALGEAE